MHPHLPVPQVAVLVAVTILVAGILFLAIYLLHKSIRETLQAGKVKPARVRDEHETAFIIATPQAVMTQLKTTEQNLQEKLAAAPL
jgi:hypothetical protein